MHRLLFKNRINALVFVAMILLSVPILVGTDGERGAIEAATQKFGAQRRAIETAPPEQSEVAPKPAPTEFTPDEELIDNTAGFDPSGWNAEPASEDGPAFESAESETDAFEG